MARVPTYLLIAALCLPLLGCPQRVQEPTPLRIGLLIQRQHFESQPTIQAVRLALDEVAAAGGLDTAEGTRVDVELFIRSDFQTPEQAVVSMRELVYQERVDAVVGPLLSRNAIPVANVAESIGVPMISPGSTHPETTAGKRWVFRMTVVNDIQGREMARFALDELAAPTAAVLFKVSEPFSRSLAEVFQEAFTAGGGQVVAAETYTFGEADFTPQLEKIRRRQPIALFLPNPGMDSVAQARSARHLGLETVLLGCDAWNVGRMAQVPEFAGAFAFQHWHPDLAEMQPEAARFLKAYQERYGSSPSDAAAHAWDAAGLVLAAARAGFSPERIRSGLASMESYRGATGAITFAGHGGDPPKAAVIVRIGAGDVALAKLVPGDRLHRRTAAEP